MFQFFIGKLLIEQSEHCSDSEVASWNAVPGFLYLNRNMKLEDFMGDFTSSETWLKYIFYETLPSFVSGFVFI